MLAELLLQREKAAGASVFDRALELAAHCKQASQDVRKLAEQRPHEFIDAWYHYPERDLTINLTKEADTAAWQAGLQGLDYNYVTVPCGEGILLPYDPLHPATGAFCDWDPPVVKVAMRPVSCILAEKEAYSQSLRTLGALTGWNPDLVNIPGWPSPVAATLATGLLGAGAGYGLGWLGEQALPDSWNKGRLRRTLAILGGLGGALPGLAWAGVNHASGKSVLDGWPMNEPAFDGKGVDEMPTDFVSGDPKVATYKEAYLGINDPTDGDNMDPSPWNWRAPLWSPYTAPDVPTINVNEFHTTVLQDPYVSRQLSPPVQAMATGLVSGASHLAGGGTPVTLISPMDVARMTAGMGTGYVSGALVGKALGALMGMPEDSQNRLKQTGLWAGAISNLIPIAFGAT